MKQPCPVKKDKVYAIDIQGLGHSGEGVGRYEDFTVFIPYALPGEQVSAKIQEVKKNYAKGKLARVERSSLERIQPKCPIYYTCGGCQLQHLSYAGQLEAKRQQVIDALTRIGKLSDVVVHPVIGADDPWYYRNKMQFPVGMTAGELAVGCFAQGTHQVINTEQCLIQHEANNRIAACVRTFMQENNIPVYDEMAGTGVIRHVVGRVGAATGEVMAVIVTATNVLPHSDKLIQQLRQAMPEIVSIVHNINPYRTNKILGNSNQLLWGKETIRDCIGELCFDISPHSFFQVNTAQAQLLYEKAVEYAGLSGTETVIDAYCGTGTISLFLARQAGWVYGIEIVEPAIKDAWRNAEENGVKNVEFIVGDALEVMPRLAAQGVRPQVVVVDPPRAGCAPAVLETFARMNPERIVYVSCNPASLARDLAILAELGYAAVEVQPVDMFPHTFHVESVSLIERKIGDYKAK